MNVVVGCELRRYKEATEELIERLVERAIKECGFTRFIHSEERVFLSVDGITLTTKMFDLCVF